MSRRDPNRGDDSADVIRKVGNDARSSGNEVRSDGNDSIS